MITGYSLKTLYNTPEAGKVGSVFRPTKIRGRDKAPCLLLHGSGAQFGYIDATRSGSAYHGPLLARAGIPCAAGEMAGQAWGNDAAMAAMDTYWNYMKTQMGLTSSKVHLFGGSMGGWTALRYMALYPEKVASATLMFPLANLVNFYNAYPAGSGKDEISNAWGVASGAPLPATANIQSALEALDGSIPTQIYYAGNDTIVSVPDIVALGATLQSEVVMDVGANGHSEATVMDYLQKTNYMQHTINFMYRNGG